LAISLHHYPERNHTRIERFTLVDIVSLSPITAPFQSPSWKIATGLNTVRHGRCRFCRAGNLDGGIGVAAESSWFKREVYFGVALRFDFNQRAGIQEYLFNLHGYF
jgi:hypothetical protein